MVSDQALPNRSMVLTHTASVDRLVFHVAGFLYLGLYEEERKGCF